MLKLTCFVLLAMTVQMAQGQPGPDGIYYSSLNYAIHQGQLEGVATLKELRQHGDFGVGSQHGLLGELVLLDGKAYRISVDGKADIMPDAATLPFAAVKRFRPEKKWSLTSPLNLQQLQTVLDSLVGTNQFAAIKISGEFSSITYKCYFPQQPPYKPIKDIPAMFFDSTNINGTMVGFFTSKSALMLNSPNYHFHFMNAALTSGGHVDACTVKNVSIEVDYADALYIKLPTAEQLKPVNLNEPRKE